MPQTTVGALITSGDGENEKILLTRRCIPPFKGQWCLPGGHVDKFEKLYDAVTREVNEETGLNFKGRYFHYFEEIYPELNIHNVAVFFAGTAQGILAAQESEVSEIDWFTMAEARSMNLAFCHNEVINAFR